MRKYTEHYEIKREDEGQQPKSGWDQSTPIPYVSKDGLIFFLICFVLGMLYSFVNWDWAFGLR